MTLINKAKIFATRAHEAINQKRKYTNAPYIIHPRSVAQRVANVTNNENLIAAAWLHDTVEDTKITLEDINATFGPKIETLVSFLTDVSKPQDGNRKQRKEIDRVHTKTASPGAKTVKLADLIDNSVSIIKYGKSFTPVFMEEMELMLDVLKEGNESLYQEAFAIVENYKALRR